MVLFLIGLASGIISGMGIGGGAILIPALVFFVIPTAVIALIVHIKNKRVNFKLTIPNWQCRYIFWDVSFDTGFL